MEKISSLKVGDLTLDLQDLPSNIQLTIGLINEAQDQFTKLSVNAALAEHAINSLAAQLQTEVTTWEESLKPAVTSADIKSGTIDLNEDGSAYIHRVTAVNGQ